eukprot:4034990-Amphidinium_carterae.1
MFQLVLAHMLGTKTCAAVDAAAVAMIELVKHHCIAYKTKPTYRREHDENHRTLQHDCVQLGPSLKDSD